MDLYAIYTDNYVYVVGLVHDTLSDHDYLLLVKLSPDDEIIWDKAVNIALSGIYEL